MVQANTNLHERVNLFVSGRKLKNLDTFSKSDPICILYERHGGRWVKIGKTEQIKDNLNPNWRTSFTMNYYFEKKQELRFKIIDDDGAGESDFLGETEATMGQIMGARAQTFTANLGGGRAGKGP
mmetsp:Transcript_6824/g.8125  ORF Transcript_6824/g.8125 Transcript_6824/m.8125 type:complete len:125 (-) Transcript_6824:1224-1598(-)